LRAVGTSPFLAPRSPGKKTGGKRRITPKQRRAIERKKRFPDEKRNVKRGFCAQRGDSAGVMILKHSKLYGHYFYGCSQYPDCNHAHAATETGKPLPGVDGRPKPTKPKPDLPATKPCRCGAQLVLKWSHRRESWFYGCARYPRCMLCSDAVKDFTMWDAAKSEVVAPAQPSPPKRGKNKKKRRGLWAMVQDDILS
jgi:ssDNA-binding Zn-finger/Zn-ribbon topoisomerase 1